MPISTNTAPPLSQKLKVLVDISGSHTGTGSLVNLFDYNLTKLTKNQQLIVIFSNYPTSGSGARIQTFGTSTDVNGLQISSASTQTRAFYTYINMDRTDYAAFYGFKEATADNGTIATFKFFDANQTLKFGLNVAVGTIVNYSFTILLRG